MVIFCFGRRETIRAGRKVQMTNRNQLPCWNNDLSLKNGQFVAVSRYFEGAMGHLIQLQKSN
jgi:hypothetical protein